MTLLSNIRINIPSLFRLKRCAIFGCKCRTLNSKEIAHPYLTVILFTELENFDTIFDIDVNKLMFKSYFDFLLYIFYFKLVVINYELSQIFVCVSFVVRDVIIPCHVFLLCIDLMSLAL